MDKIHHIAIQVKNIKKAIKWYVEKFDANLDYEVKRFTQFKKVRLYGSVTNIFEHKNATQSYANSVYAFNFSRAWMTGLKIDF